MKPESDTQYTDKEAQQRFKRALEGAMKTAPKPLKEKPKLRGKASGGKLGK